MPQCGSSGVVGIETDPGQEDLDVHSTMYPWQSRVNHNTLDFIPRWYVQTRSGCQRHGDKKLFQNGATPLCECWATANDDQHFSSAVLRYAGRIHTGPDLSR